jgi:membrane protein
MPEQNPDPSDHACKNQEAAKGRRGGAVRKTGGNQQVIPEGSLEGNGRLNEREAARETCKDKAEKPSRVTFLTAVQGLSHGFVRAGMEIGKRWFRHDHSRSAAAIAFYSIFSLIPLLVILTKLAGMWVGREAAQANISLATAMLLNQESTEYLLALVEQQNTTGWNGWMSLFAFGVLLFTASKVVVELREALSRIFGMRQHEGRGGWLVGLLLKRAVPVLLIVSLGFIIGISAMLGAFLHFFAGSFYGGYSDLAVWKLIEGIGSGLMLTLVFTLVLRMLPPEPPCLRAAVGGAIVASVLLIGLRNLMNLYFQNAGVTSVYGAAVTLAVVLIWIYFSVQIFFIGAEVGGVLQRRWLDKRGHEGAKMT